MKWASPGGSPIASSSWTRDRSSKLTNRENSLRRRSRPEHNSFSAKFFRIEESAMKRSLCLWLSLFFCFISFGSAGAETTLEKVGKSGTLIIGTRTGSPPFAYINKNNEWVGFSIDLVEKAIVPALNKKLNKQIKIEKKETAPPTRIPLLTSNAVDLVAETMTDTQSRRDSVDFSLTFFATGAQFLVKKGSPIKGIQTLAGKRIAAQQGSTNAKIIRERVPNAKLIEFPDQPAAFQALAQGQVQGYTNDGIQLAGLKAKAPKPD